MIGSLQLGTYFGIPVRMHGLLGLLILWIVLTADAPGLALLYVLVLLLGVGLHELGHCLVARRFGARVHDITFWPLGGMARMSELPEDTRAEVQVALAGPAVNFVLAAITAALLLLTGSGPESWNMDPGAQSSLLNSSLSAFFWFNIMLGTFNLLPAFPMDGGRILRAALGSRGDWVAATESAVKVSRWLAAAMVVFAFANKINGGSFRTLPLLLIAGFVWISGTRELWSVRLRHGKLPFGGNGSFAGVNFSAGQNPFGNGGPFAQGFPGVEGNPFENADQDDQQMDFDSQAAQPSLDAEVLQKEPGQASRRLSETDIRQLEDFRGRLKSE